MIKIRQNKIYDCTIYFFILTSLIYLSCGNSGSSDDVDISITWTTKSPMRTPRMNLGLAVVNYRIYALGGYSGSVVSIVEEYDPVNDSWIRKSDMPTPKMNFVTAVINSKIYTIGGFSEYNGGRIKYSIANEEYTPATDQWTVKADLPLVDMGNNWMGNSYIGGASINGKIYVVIFNTYISDGTTATYSYDPIEDTWDTNLAPVPFSYTSFSVTPTNNKLFVIKNESDTCFYAEGSGTEFAAYDIFDDLWVLKNSMDTCRSFLSLCSNGNNIYAIGGVVRNGTTQSDLAIQNTVNTVEVYDTETGNWAEGSSAPTARHSQSSVVLDNKIYIIGGATEDVIGGSSLESVTPIALVEEGHITN